MHFEELWRYVRHLDDAGYHERMPGDNPIRIEKCGLPSPGWFSVADSLGKVAGCAVVLDRSLFFVGPELTLIPCAMAYRWAVRYDWGPSGLTEATLSADVWVRWDPDGDLPEDLRYVPPGRDKKLDAVAHTVANRWPQLRDRSVKQIALLHHAGDVKMGGVNLGKDRLT